MKPNTLAPVARSRKTASAVDRALTVKSARRSRQPDPVYHDPRPAPLSLSLRAPRLTRASGGDQAAIHRLLLSVFQGPSAAEFQAQQDEPDYSPADRLVVRRGGEIAAHLRLSKRMLHFGALPISAANFMDLVTAPLEQGQGFASALLAAAERVALQAELQIGLTRTVVPSLFSRQGWTSCGSRSFSTANARKILAEIGAQSAPRHPDGEDANDLPNSLNPPAPPAFHIRPLRMIELPAVVQLYEQLTRAEYGWPVRTADYWDWLWHRSGFDTALIATLGCARHDHLHLPPAIAGYAFVKEGRIVELLATHDADGHRAAEQLLARVCGDAIERGAAEVRLDAPPADRLHAIFARAGGRSEQGQFDSDQTPGGETLMAKLFDPLAFLHALAPLLTERTVAARLAPSSALGLCIEPDESSLVREPVTLRLTLAADKIGIEPSPLGRNTLTLRLRDLTPLLLGHWKVHERIAQGAVRASNSLASRLAGILFPQFALWRSPLDELMA